MSRSWSDDDKQKAVKFSLTSTVNDAANKFGIHPSTLKRWRGRYRAEKDANHKTKIIQSNGFDTRNFKKALTTSELIVQLQQFPDETPIVVEAAYEGYHDICTVTEIAIVAGAGLGTTQRKDGVLYVPYYSGGGLHLKAEDGDKRVESVALLCSTKYQSTK